MKEFNNSVISKPDFDTVSNLLDGTDFFGVDYEKFISLFEYGFVYDGRINTLISTYSIDVWNEKDSPIHFGVIELTMDRINHVFNENSEKILSDNKLTRQEWDDLCDSYKINLIELSTGELGLKCMEMNVTSSDLIKFLLDKID